MKVTTSNLLNGVTPSITTGATAGGLPANITDPDFSAFYVSASSSTLVMSFGSTDAINYVAVAGLNIKGNSDDTSYVSVSDGATEVQRITVNNNQVVVVNFASQTFATLVVTVVNGAGNLTPIVKYVAAGTSLEIPNSGEQAGYSRQYLERNYKNKTTFNSLTEPVGVLRKRTQPKGKLSVPNVTRAFSEGDWQTFLDFAISNIFFILERDAELDTGLYYAPAAYLCYELDAISVKAHSSTRLLNNLSIGFKVHNGL